MPEIKNTFTQGKMNKDLDERIVPNGQYRDATNIQVSTSDGSDIGTVQNILGNTRVGSTVGGSWKCVGSIADEKNDVLYSFIHSSGGKSAIMQYDKNGNETTVLADVNGDVLKFSSTNIITGINIIDGLLFWTDGSNEPKKINIQRCIDGTSNFSTHTTLYVNGTDTGEDIKEEHITVIKKRPTQAPRIDFNTADDGVLNSGSINSFSIDGNPVDTSVSITASMNRRKIWESGSAKSLTPDPYPLITGDTISETYATTHSITIYDGIPYSVNVGDILLLSDPGVIGVLPNNAQIRLLVTAPPSINMTAGFGVAGGTISDDPEYTQTFTGTILSIDSGTSLDEIKYDFVVEDLNDLLFDKSFPRFATRYKYEDGEYSAFSPFTQVGFVAGEFSIHPTKGPYNSGMETRVKSITLKEFVTHDIPLDVVEIDLLYKPDNSNIVYSIETIKPSLTGATGFWETVDIKDSEKITDITLPSAGSVPASNTGYYKITADNIHAALPSNQLLRPWDNVPKIAKAQEVTGNRLVYGNYVQNLDLGDYTPYIVTRYEERKFLGTDIDYTDGKQSVKSQRTYQGGVVYGDKYGRETPVFSGGVNQIVKIPYDSNQTSVFNGMASRSNRLYVTNSPLNLPIMDNSSSSTLDYEPYYFKVFIKETASEYYNLVMDRVYRAEEDGNLWISFPSSDRNKIQEDDYMILKKGLGTLSNPATQVPIENKYKVIDIQNEAPEFIKKKYQELGELDGDGDLSTLYLNGAQPYAGANTLVISKDSFLNENLTDIQEEYNNGAKCSLTFKITNVNSDEIISRRYKITSLTTTDSSPALYTVILDRAIVEADGWVETSIGVLDTSLKTTIWKEEQQEWEEFQGRFFVKILSDIITDEYLETQIGIVKSTTLAARTKLFYISDRTAINYGGDAAVGIHGSGLHQGLFANTNTRQNNSSNPANQLISNERNEWKDQNLEFDQGETSGGWFIDAAFSAAQQPTILTDTSGWGTGVHDPGANIYDASVSGTLRKTSGATSVNGMTGVIETNGRYCSTAAGHFMWLKQFANGQVRPGATTYDAQHGDPNVYGQSGNGGGEYYMHLSFSKVGEHLAPSTDFNVSATGGQVFNGTQSISQWNLQHIHNYNQQQGNWKHSDATQFYDNNVPVPNMRDIVEKQWDVTHNHPENEAILQNLVIGSKFQFENDKHNTVFTILKVTEKHLYNHTSWNRTYVWNGTENVLDDKSSPSGESVWAAWHTWNNNKTSTNWTAVENKIRDFANPDNRRVCYIIELDKNPNDECYDGTNYGIQAILHSLTNNSDLSGGPVQTPGFLKFVKNYVSENSTIISDDPAIWETEPKENTDLDIYYEASDAIPLILDKNSSSTTNPVDNRKGHMIAPIGTAVRCTKADSNISTPNFGDCVVKSWDGNIVELDPGLTALADDIDDGSGGLTPASQSSESDQTNVFNTSELKFYKKDLSYITAGIYQVSEITSGKITKLALDRTLNKKIGLPYFNCFAFGNGVESNRIRDDFNQPFISNGARASSTLQEQYKEEHRKSGLIYSGIYNDTGGINNLNQFIMAEKITKDLNPTYGSIQKLFSRRISLIAFCEDRVVGITANKNALYNADGKPQIVASDAVLGDANPFVGDYGISKDPESFAKESYRAYFTDKQRGAVLRLSMDGLTPISDAGMRDWFRDNLRDGNSLVGTYDSHKKDYNITVDYGNLGGLVSNPEFEIGEFNQYQLINTELASNIGFDPSSQTLSSNVINNGDFNIDPSAGAPDYWNFTGDGSAWYNDYYIFYDDGAGTTAQGKHFYQDISSSTNLIEGDKVDISFELKQVDLNASVLPALTGSSVWSNATYNASRIKVLVYGSDGSGAQIKHININSFNNTFTFNDITLTAANSTNDPSKFNTIRFAMMLIEDEHCFGIDNVELKYKSDVVSNWTLNDSVRNPSGIMNFLDGGTATQTGAGAYVIDSSKKYEIELELEEVIGSSAIVSVNGLDINVDDLTANSPTYTQNGTVNHKVFFPNSGALDIEVSGGEIGIDLISLKELDLLGGNVDDWDMNGAPDQTIISAFMKAGDGRIVFEEAPIGTYLNQVTPVTNRVLDFNDGAGIRVSFNLDKYRGSGGLKFYLYNADGEGFEHVITMSDGDKYFIGTIGTATKLDSADPKVGKFGFEVTSGSVFSGNIDSVDLVITSQGSGTTVSYSEDVKGWTSFKSFIPESGVSISGDYYTFNGGRCYKHHSNQIRNNFYNSQASSDITFLLNESPTTIKNFNTLNYDGDENWSCDSVVTDQQSGSVQSFIEKEGKWFNYIKGGTGVDTKAFNFQGIGLASNIQYNTP